MALPLRSSGDWHVRGLLTSNDINVESGTPIDNFAVSDTAKISAWKYDGRQKYRVTKPDGTLIDTAEEFVIFYARGANGATLITFRVTPIGIPSGTRDYDVDLEKSTGGGAWATMLTAPITINSGSTARTPVSATLSVTAIAEGDAIRITITPGGASGTYGDGVVIEAKIDEEGKW